MAALEAAKSAVLLVGRCEEKKKKILAPPPSPPEEEDEESGAPMRERLRVERERLDQLKSMLTSMEATKEREAIAQVELA